MDDDEDEVMSDKQLFMENLTTIKRFNEELHDRLKDTVVPLLTEEDIYSIITNSFKIKDPKRYKKFCFNANMDIIDMLLHTRSSDFSRGTKLKFVKHLIKTRQLNPYFRDSDGRNLVEILLSRPRNGFTSFMPTSHLAGSEIDYEQDFRDLLELFNLYGLEITRPTFHALNYYTNLYNTMLEEKKMTKNAYTGAISQFLPKELEDLSAGYIIPDEEMETRLNPYSVSVDRLRFLFGMN